MEEILSSIRRIIADDGTPRPKTAEPAKPVPKPVAAPVRAAKNSKDEVDSLLAGLGGTEPRPASPPPAAPPPPSPAAPTPSAPPPSTDVLDLTETMTSAQRAVVDQARRDFEYHTGIDRSLLSPTTSAAVDSAFNSLAQTVLTQNARTLDDLVREMLRPLLKAWLDDNLPSMVERMVRAEIERVSRGRG